MKIKLLLLNLSGLLLIFSSIVRAELIERIVAIVNNEIITESDIKKFDERLSKGGGMVDEMLLLDKTTDELKKDKRAKLNFLINEKILDSEVKRLNMSVTIERVEQKIRDIAKTNGISRADMMTAIKNQGVSVSDYQDMIKNSIERQSLVESEVSSKIRVSDEDVLAEYLRKNPNSDQTVYEYSVAHILFSPQKGGAEAAHERAEKVLQKIRSGESFEVLAQQYSEDPNFSSGGFLGTFKSGEFLKEIEASVQKLNPGELTGIVKSRIGFHIVKLLSKKLIEDPKFEAAKEKIRAELFDKALKKHFATWLEQKRDESFVRINDPSLK